MAEKYTFVRALGSGGQGKVAEVKRKNKRYAIKQFNFKKDFDEEAQVLRELGMARCDYFPQVRGELNYNGCPSLVMELLDTSLLALKRHDLLSEKKVLKIAIIVTRALEALHAHGFVHCDIKPDNVMLSGDKRVVLVDFGLAHRFLDESGAHVPEQKVNSFKGTWMYSSKNTL